jgi:hypothetical protein
MARGMARGVTGGWCGAKATLMSFAAFGLEQGRRRELAEGAGAIGARGGDASESASMGGSRAGAKAGTRQ